MPPENLGVRLVEEVTVDVTSLTNGGNEPFATFIAESGLDVVDSVTVVGLENGDSYVVQPDHISEHLTVTDYTGANVAASTDIGEVRVRLEGRR